MQKHIQKFGDHSAHLLAHGRGAVIACIAGLLMFASGTVGALDYADRTPGHKLLSSALSAYEAGQYVSALRKFERAAHWADKVAQFNLGVMHLHGQGTDPDPARAWAWFELAAERAYPRMTEVAGRVWETLDETQRTRARRIHDEELLGRYGDAVAVPRTARRMRRDQRRATGSRVGFRRGGLRVYEVADIGWGKSGEISFSGRVHTSGSYYDPVKFDFHEIVAAETRLFEAAQQGKVRLGEFKLIDDEDGTESTRAGKDDGR
jgi:hypothetical protein